MNRIVDTMPLLVLNPEVACDAGCATKIVNYMFLNFYGANTTDCEDNALPLALPSAP